MEDEPNKKYKIGHVRSLTVLLLVVVTVLGGGPILHGCDSSNQEWRPWKERKNMEPAKRDSSHMVAIPPIDIEAPRNTETATFALG
jgi:hypothetical protein